MKTYRNNSDYRRITDDNGKSYPECLIIESPEMKSVGRCLAEGGLAACLWGYWFYLWAPLICVLTAWIDHDFMMIPEETMVDGFMEQLKLFGYGVVGIVAWIAGWCLYNWKRYGSVRRRKKSLATDVRKLATALSVSGRRLAEIQLAKRLVFMFAEDDSVKEVSFDVGPDMLESC